MWFIVGVEAQAGIGEAGLHTLLPAARADVPHLVEGCVGQHDRGGAHVASELGFEREQELERRVSGDPEVHHLVVGQFLLSDPREGFLVGEERAEGEGAPEDPDLWPRRFLPRHDRPGDAMPLCIAADAEATTPSRFATSRSVTPGVST